MKNRLLHSNRLPNLYPAGLSGRSILIRGLRAAALTATLAVLIGCVHSGTPQQSGDAPAEALSHFSLALLAESEGDLSGALTHLEKAIEADPRESRLYAAAAVLALKNEQPDRAVEFARQYIRAHPDTPEAYLFLARIHSLAEQNAEAEKTYRAILDRFPGNPHVVALTARYYLQKENREEAVAVLRRGLKVSPDESDLQHLLATLLIEKARSAENIADARSSIREGIRLLKKSLETEPDDALRWQQLGIALNADGQTDEALDAVRKARQTDPSDLLSARQLLNLLLQSGQIDKAFSVYNQLADDTGTSPDVWLLLLTQQLEPKNYPLLKDHLEKRVSDGPDPVPAFVYSQLGMLYLGEEDPEKAQNAFEQALEQNPEAVEPLYYLMALLAEKEEYDPALEYGQRFQDAAPDELMTGTFYYQFAILHERSGDLEQAEDLFRQAIEHGREQTVAAANNYVAYMWAERGEKLDMALQMVQQALEFDPDNGAYLDTLGWIYYMQGRYEEASVELRKALDSGENDPVIQEHLDAALDKL